MDSFWTGKQVCVTGGTGFLGYHLVRQLIDRGAQVRVLGLPPRLINPLWSMDNVDNRFGDLLDRHHLRQALAGCAVVFHTAGLVAVWGPALAKMYEMHLKGTRLVLENAPSTARIVHTSSIVTVGATRDGQALTEDSRFNLTGLKVDYVHAKRAAEAIALDAARRGRDVVVANPGYLIGPEDYEKSVIGRLMARFWKGRLIGCSAGGWNVVDVRDAAAGHLLAAEHGQAGRRYILGGENLPMAQFFQLLIQASGVRPRLFPWLPAWLMHGLAFLAEAYALCHRKTPYPALQSARLNRFYWYCSSDRARSELGYHARPLAQALADSYAWHSGFGRVPLRGLNRWMMRRAG